MLFLNEKKTRLVINTLLASLRRLIQKLVLSKGFLVLYIGTYINRHYHIFSLASPGRPYGGNIVHFNTVEANMKLRYAVQGFITVSVQHCSNANYLIASFLYNEILMFLPYLFQPQISK